MHEDDKINESFDLNCWHRWEKPIPWWMYGVLLSFGCSFLALGLVGYSMASRL